MTLNCPRLSALSLVGLTLAAGACDAPASPSDRARDVLASRTATSLPDVLSPADLYDMVETTALVGNQPLLLEMDVTSLDVAASLSSDLGSLLVTPPLYQFEAVPAEINGNVALQLFEEAPEDHGSFLDSTLKTLLSSLDLQSDAVERVLLLENSVSAGAISFDYDALVLMMTDGNPVVVDPVFKQPFLLVAPDAESLAFVELHPEQVCAQNKPCRDALPASGMVQKIRGESFLADIDLPDPREATDDDETDSGSPEVCECVADVSNKNLGPDSDKTQENHHTGRPHDDEGMVIGRPGSHSTSSGFDTLKTNAVATCTTKPSCEVNGTIKWNDTAECDGIAVNGAFSNGYIHTFVRSVGKKTKTLGRCDGIEVEAWVHHLLRLDRTATTNFAIQLGHKLLGASGLPLAAPLWDVVDDLTAGGVVNGVGLADFATFTCVPATDAAGG